MMGEPLWKQCLAWLRGWNMVPPGGEVRAVVRSWMDCAGYKEIQQSYNNLIRAGFQVTSPGELVLLLRDGVVSPQQYL